MDDLQKKIMLAHNNPFSLAEVKEMDSKHKQETSVKTEVTSQEGQNAQGNQEIQEIQEKQENQIEQEQNKEQVIKEKQGTEEKQEMLVDVEGLPPEEAQEKIKDKAYELVKECIGILLESTRDEYHSDLESFEQHKEKKAEEAVTEIREYFESVNNGYKLILSKIETMES